MTITTTASADADEREHIERLLQAERRSLELIARGARLGDILSDLCAAIDAQDPGLMCAVMLVDTDGTHLRNVQYCTSVHVHLPRNIGLQH